jgi:cell division septation protein DedD
MSRYDDEDDTFERPSGGGSSRGVGPSSIAYESRKRPGRRRLITSLVVLVALGGFVGIVWHAYNQGKAGGNDAVVPLLKAEDSPTKVRPDQPGGMDVPNQDKLIYDRIAPGSQMAAPQIERLLPPAEAPVARPAAPIAPAPAAQAPATAAPTDLQPPPLGERQVTTAPPINSVPAQPPIPVAPPAPSQAVPPAQAPAAQAPRPAPTQQAAVAPSTPIPSGAARIQLGAVRSADAAQKEWARIQGANRDILAGLNMNVVTADLGERGVYYRIQAGPAADAADLCNKLKARNVGCIVVR